MQKQMDVETGQGASWKQEEIVYVCDRCVTGIQADTCKHHTTIRLSREASLYRIRRVLRLINVLNNTYEVTITDG